LSPNIKPKLELFNNYVPKLELGNEGESWSLGTRGNIKIIRKIPKKKYLIPIFFINNKLKIIVSTL